MCEESNTLERLQQICRQQYEELECKAIQISDLESEVRILRSQEAALREQIQTRQNRIDDLERWCAHLQSQLDELKDMGLAGVLLKIARKVKKLLLK